MQAPSCLPELGERCQQREAGDGHAAHVPMESQKWLGLNTAWEATCQSLLKEIIASNFLNATDCPQSPLDGSALPLESQATVHSSATVGGGMRTRDRKFAAIGFSLPDRGQTDLLLIMTEFKRELGSRSGSGLRVRITNPRIWDSGKG